jgi:hypothetical protein
MAVTRQLLARTLQRTFAEDSRMSHEPKDRPVVSCKRNRKCLGLLVLALTLASAGNLRAETLLSGSIGSAFGGKTDNSKVTYGGTLTFQGSVFGFAVDFGYTPDFYGKGPLGNNNLVTLMGNLVVMSPGTVRLYGSTGLGLVKSRVEDAAGLFRVDSNELGFGVGGGLVILPGDGHVGLHGDIRYFRSLTDPQPDDHFDVDLGNLDFWRGEAGITFRF